MGAYSVGRGEENDIIVPDSSVSRRHAELIEKQPGTYNLRDLGSVNGTYYYGPDGWVPTHFAELERNDQVRLGTYTTSVGALLDALASGQMPKASDEQTSLKRR